MKFRFLFTFIIISMIVLFLSPIDIMADDERLELNIQTWFGGHGKEGELIPISFTITNHGPRMEGELAVHYTGQQQGEDIAAIMDLALPEGTAVQVWMTLPARYYHQDNNEIVYYEGGIHNGKRIDFADGNKFLQIQVDRPETLYMGVFADANETYQFMNLLNQDQQRLTMHQLEAQTFPDESYMLESLDVLALNNYSSDQLSERQITAIREWVQSGGKLILSGGAGYPKTEAPFSDISPVTYKGTASLDELPALERIASRELMMQSPLTIADVELTNGTSLLSQEDTVLYAESNYGRGMVWFVAYDIALEPLASWSGNSQLWTYLFQDILISSQWTGIGPRGELWEMSGALDYFPSLAPPSLGLLSIIFLIYMIVAGPVLYFGLKKIDRRGWLWVAVPMTAIVFGLGIYAVGAAERNTTLVQQLSVLELYGDGTGQKTSAASFFVPKGGNYEVQPPHNELIMPFWPRYGHDNGLTLTETRQRFYSPESGSSALFIDVPFWSIRKLWLEELRPREYGQLEISFLAEPSGWHGSITNQTGTDLTDVLVFYGQATLTLGELKAGDSVDFQQNHTASGSRSHYRNIADIVFPYYGNNDYRQKRAVLQTALALQKNDFQDPIVIGFSEQTGEAFQVDGELIESLETVVWLQRAYVETVQGDQVYIPRGYIRPNIHDNQLDFIEYQQDSSFVYIGTGSLELEYVLPHIEQVTYDEFSLWLSNNPDISLSIWNGMTESWEPIDQQATQSSFTDVETYIINSAIRLKVTSSIGHTEFIYPEISLQGGSQHD